MQASFSKSLDNAKNILRKSSLLRKSAQSFLDPYLSLKSIFWEKSFKNVQTLVLTIGFPRSGSSLLGYLLTAHPNMVFADEPIVCSDKLTHSPRDIYQKKRPAVDCLYQANLLEIFNYLLIVDYIRQLASLNKYEPNSFFFSGGRHTRYIHIPNQYQGRFKQLKVIGVKASNDNAKCLSRNNILENLKKRLEENNISLKFIFTVRNPYDIVSRKWYTAIERISAISILCEDNAKIIEQIPPKDIFISKHEDMVNDPRSQLTKLCSFIKAPIPPGYLDDCSSQVVRELHKSRVERDWTKGRNKRKRIAALIEKYDFFSGYDWES